MVYSCNFCSASFSDRENCSSHQHRFHPDEVRLPVYNCFLCLFNSRKLSAIHKHMRGCNSKFTNCCRSCFMRFNDAHLVAQHMNSLHSLPVFGPEYDPIEATLETAFNGNKLLKLSITQMTEIFRASCSIKDLQLQPN